MKCGEGKQLVASCLDCGFVAKLPLVSRVSNMPALASASVASRCALGSKRPSQRCALSNSLTQPEADAGCPHLEVAAAVAGHVALKDVGEGNAVDFVSTRVGAPPDRHVARPRLRVVPANVKVSQQLEVRDFKIVCRVGGVSRVGHCAHASMVGKFQYQK
eukprot:365932-Chlamydomonas_euryale.AAC.18